ncbi:hypothetical protein, partial [Mycobacterium tuberculosis]|uniref:hypothetical protein n=1 Tax=Mycobacterium tuberculosis TaxID=1773 RepID=UPI001BE0C8E3
PTAPPAHANHHHPPPPDATAHSPCGSRPALFNHRRLYQYCGDVPPVELEAAYYAQRQRPAAG